jgi:hypothetical protein
VIGFIWALLGAVFGAGIVYGTMQLKIKKAQTDVNNIGKIGKENDAKQERRWKHMIANQIEELEPKDKAIRIAKLLREDAWRN